MNWNLGMKNTIPRYGCNNKKEGPRRHKILFFLKAVIILI
jgi:hypothetical protein